MPARPASDSTRLIILSPAALHREAWRALLAHQPGISVCGAVDDISQLASLVHPIQPTTLLVDLPTPQPDLARQLKALVPHGGLIFLVQSYDLAHCRALPAPPLRFRDGRSATPSHHAPGAMKL
jgi:DNA-binding NarL/FixJ family response regulator